MLRQPLSPEDFAAHSDWIGGAVRTLLSHYFDPAHADEVIAMGLADWIDVLEPFSADCIGKARQRWIASERRRPTPADIKAICFQIAAGK